jgi:type VI secretion system secreted protein VgrG
MTIHFSFEIDGVSAKLNVGSFELREGLSELYVARLRLVSDDVDVDLTKAVGQPATLKISRERAEDRYLNGIVSRLEQGGDAAHKGVYFATIVPAFYKALHRHDIRIFQGKSVPQIVEDVLKGSGLTSFKMNTQGSYAPREYCVQYRESDWAFISRLLEEEGITYAFEHTESAHTLVFTSNTKNAADIPGAAKVAYSQQRGAMAHDDSVTDFVWAEEMRPSMATLNDFNFTKPTLSLKGEANASGDKNLEIYDYPGEHETPDEGKRLAEIRLEESEAQRAVGRGTSSCARLLPGHMFELEDHVRDAFNAKYLITRVVHRGSQPIGQAESGGEYGYSNEFEVMSSKKPFRPVRRTPRPRVNGLESATVVGAAGEEIFVDKYGRVKVQFHWDRLGKTDDKSSCWIRVSQLWAGAGYGGMFIPRVGHEVLVDFLSGDPDRPVIVGRVYNAHNMPPYALPAEATKSTIRTKSSPNDSGYNELRFEDKTGQEEIFLHGQKDWNIKIEHDKAQLIGHDDALEVKNDQTILIGHDRDKTVNHDQSETIKNNKSIQVGGSHTENIDGDESVSIKGDADRSVTGSQSVAIDDNSSLTVKGNHEETVNKEFSLDVGGGKSESVGKASSESVGGDKSVDVTGASATTVGKDMSLEVKKNLKETIGEEAKIEVGKQYTLAVGDGSVSVKKDGTIVIKGKDITIKGDGKINIQAGSKVVIKSDGPVDLEASGAVKIKGSTVGLN